MENKKLAEALNNVEMCYDELVAIANDIVNPIVANVNALVENLTANCNDMPMDAIRNFILKLQLAAYSLSEVKEKSALKSELAETIQKTALATQYLGADGPVATKEKIAFLNISQETLAQTTYELVSNLLKTKLDQTHRLIDSLKSILMSRMQEAKLLSLDLGTETPIE